MHVFIKFIRLFLVLMVGIFFVIGCGGVEDFKYECDGQGTIKYSGGSVYKGECKKDKRDGQGVLTYSNGSKYDGEWKDDKKNGEGKYTYESGTVYIGEWKDDKKNGKGKYINQYGMYQGIWEDGNLTEVTNQDSYQEAYTYFNKIRKQAGMIELEPNGILEESAQSHSNYIHLHNKELNGLEYHSESKDKEGFTGIKARDRAIYQGYFSKNVGEGISHQKTAKISINDLMTAIYHRFGILTFTKNEVGIGFTKERKSMTRNFVQNTGNSILNELCQEDSYSSGRYYYKVCKNENHKIESELFENATINIENQNPKYVLWPSKDSIDNLYEFNGETPDPMPDYNETGNPISIQFNEYYYPNQISMKSFQLFKGDKEIKKTRILTKETDPNNKFSNYQYALFPLKVLEKNTEYKAKFKYRYKGNEKNIIWSFKTMK